MKQVHSDVRSVQRNSLQNMMLISIIKGFIQRKLLHLENNKKKLDYVSLYMPKTSVYNLNKNKNKKIYLRIKDNKAL